MELFATLDVEFQILQGFKKKGKKKKKIRKRRKEFKIQLIQILPKN